MADFLNLSGDRKRAVALLAQANQLKRFTLENLKRSGLPSISRFLRLPDGSSISLRITKNASYDDYTVVTSIFGIGSLTSGGKFTRPAILMDELLGAQVVANSLNLRTPKKLSNGQPYLIHQTNLSWYNEEDECIVHRGEFTPFAYDNGLHQRDFDYDRYTVKIAGEKYPAPFLDRTIAIAKKGGLFFEAAYTSSINQLRIFIYKIDYKFKLLALLRSHLIPEGSKYNGSGATFNSDITELHFIHKKVGFNPGVTIVTSTDKWVTHSLLFQFDGQGQGLTTYSGNSNAPILPPENTWTTRDDDPFAEVSRVMYPGPFFDIAVDFSENPIGQYKIIGKIELHSNFTITGSYSDTTSSSSNTPGSSRIHRLFYSPYGISYEYEVDSPISSNTSHTLNATVNVIGKTATSAYIFKNTATDEITEGSNLHNTSNLVLSHSGITNKIRDTTNSFSAISKNSSIYLSKYDKEAGELVNITTPITRYIANSNNGSDSYTYVEDYARNRTPLIDATTTVEGTGNSSETIHQNSLIYGCIDGQGNPHILYNKYDNVLSNSGGGVDTTRVLNPGGTTNTSTDNNTPTVVTIDEANIYYNLDVVDVGYKNQNFELIGPNSPRFLIPHGQVLMMGLRDKTILMNIKNTDIPPVEIPSRQIISIISDY